MSEQPGRDRPDADRREWLRVAAVGIAVAALAATASGIAVAWLVRSSATTTERFSIDRSVFPGPADVHRIASGVLPAVVTIKAVRPACSSSPLAGSMSQVDEGTGMIVRSDGEILTNNHVIAQATSISVDIPGRSAPLPATLVGTDPGRDVAMLKVANVSNLPMVRLGLGSVHVGDQVVAIGDALGLSARVPSVTAGIISAERRNIRAGGDCAGSERLSGLLQTQAAINPGNSGGPLVDSAGAVVGMSTATASQANSGSRAQNVGFAIPVSELEALLPGLRRGGSAGRPGAFLGVDVVTLTAPDRAAYGLVPTAGALIASIVPGSPAARAGLAANDVIVTLGGVPITSTSSVALTMDRVSPGQIVTLVVYRGAHRLTVTLRTTSTPAPVS